MPASLAFISAITLFETREPFARHARLTSTFAYRPGLAARARIVELGGLHDYTRRRVLPRAEHVRLVLNVI